LLAEQHPLVSEALVGISVSVCSTATVLEVLAAMKLADLSQLGTSGSVKCLGIS